MSTTRFVKCPRCGDRQNWRPNAIYYCPRCRGQFDDAPDEGGDYSTDPSRRLEQREELAKRKRKGKG